MNENEKDETTNQAHRTPTDDTTAATTQTAGEVTAQTATETVVSEKPGGHNCRKSAKDRAKREREEQLQRTCEAIKMANSYQLISFGNYAGEKVPSASEAVRRIVSAYQSSASQNPWRWE